MAGDPPCDGYHRFWPRFRVRNGANCWWAHQGPVWSSRYILRWNHGVFSKESRCVGSKLTTWVGTFFFFFFFFHTQILVQKRVYLGPKKWPIWGAKTPKIGPKMAKKHFLEHQKRLNWWWLGSTLPTFWFLSDPISPPLAHFWDTRNRPPQGVRTTKVGVCPKTRKCVSYQHCYKFPKNSFEKIYYRCLYVTICIFFLGET